jgi:hypothetical protein
MRMPSTKDETNHTLAEAMIIKQHPKAKQAT